MAWILMIEFPCRIFTITCVCLWQVRGRDNTLKANNCGTFHEDIYEMEIHLSCVFESIFLFFFVNQWIHKMNVALHMIKPMGQNIKGTLFFLPTPYLCFLVFCSSMFLFCYPSMLTIVHFHGSMSKLNSDDNIRV